MERIREFFKNIILKSSIPHFLYTLLDLVSMVLSFITLGKESTDISWKILATIIIMNSVFLIVISIIETISHYKNENEINIEKQKNEWQKGIVSRSRNFSQILSKFFYKITLQLNKSDSEIMKENYKLASKIERINYKIEEDKNKGFNENEISERYEPDIVAAQNEYHNAMLGLYNNFLSRAVADVQSIIQEALLEKECTLIPAVCVKQFDKVFVKGVDTDYSSFSIITTYRDHNTYVTAKRKIADIQYELSAKNTAFMHCIINPVFAKNNIKESDPSYANQTEHFLDYYDCVMVVPIRCTYSSQEPRQDNYYGFLACDILNKGQFDDSKLFDTNMVQLLSATANILATFFNNLDNYWETTFDRDFLSQVYDMKWREFNG